MSSLPPYHRVDCTRGHRKPFEEAEFRKRMKAAQDALAGAGLDGMLIHTPENIYYLTGYETTGYFEYQVLVLPAAGDPCLLVRNVERLNVDEYSWLPGAYTWRDGDDYYLATAQLVDLLIDGRRVGIEKHSWFVTAAVAQLLGERLGGRQLADSGRLVEQLRLIKSSSELRYVEEAAQLADIAMAAAIAAAGDGANELDIAAEAHAQQIRHGGEYPALPHYVSSGERTELGHAHWTNRVIRAGETVKLEFLGARRRYHAGLTRTISVGEPCAELRAGIEACVAVQDETFLSLAPGVSVASVTRQARTRLASSATVDVRLRLGYSMGIGFPPIAGEGQTADFRESSGLILREGMVFHMLSVLSVGRLVSDTVTITADGCRRLTSTARRLFVA